MTGVTPNAGTLAETDVAPPSSLRTSGSQVVALPRAPRAGDALAGCRIERELGRGGMGAVYLGREPSGAPVALKVMLDPDRSETARERFRRECDTLAGLDHPGIVKVLRADADGPLPCLVMEFVEGSDLERVLEEGKLDLNARLLVAEQVCRAVHHAHERGVVHRDLKPANVLIDAEGRAKVTDFGLVRELGRDTRLTKTGATLGTPGYMSPEQVRGEKDAGPASDVFSLGVILYEVIAGEAPFAGDSAVETIAKIVKSTPDDPSALCPWAGPAHDAVTLKALAKAPQQRWASAGELADAIAGLREHGGGSRLARRLRRAAVAVGGVGLLLAAALALATREGPLSNAELEAQGEELHAAARDWLAEPAPITSGQAEARRLVSRLGAVRARAPDWGTIPLSLARADREVRAVQGLLALAAGDAGAARSALAGLGEKETPALRALRGGCGGPDAVRDLTAALEHGVARADLRAWRVRATADAGLTERSARMVLDDLAVLKAAGLAKPAQLEQGVRAHVILGEIQEAQEALAALPAPHPDLAWSVALLASERDLGDDPRAVYERLKTLPAQATPDPRRAPMADRVLQDVRLRLAKLGTRFKLKKDEREGIMLGLRLAFLLAPRPLPRDILEPLKDKATSFKGSGDLDLAGCLGDVCPNDKDVQLAAGYLAQRLSNEVAQRRCLPYVRRAIELETDPAAKAEIRVALCLLIGQIVFRANEGFTREECQEAVALADQVLPNLHEAELRAEVLGTRASCLRCLGDDARALRDVNDAIELGPDMPALRLVRARIHYNAGRKREALDDALHYALHRAVSDASAKSDSAVVLAWTVARELGDELLAIDAVRAMVRGRGHYVGWWVRLAYLELKAGDPGAARQHLDVAVNKWEAHRSSYRELPRYGPRLEELTRAVKEKGAAALPEATAFVAWLEELRLGKSFWAVGK